MRDFLNFGSDGRVTMNDFETHPVGTQKRIDEMDRRMEACFTAARETITIYAGPSNGGDRRTLRYKSFLEWERDTYG